MKERILPDLTTKKDLRAHIINAIVEVYSFQNETEQCSISNINEDTILLESGLDSLGFAILVTTLEEQLGYDPFSLSSESFYPKTFGEFVDFYYKNKP